MKTQSRQGHVITRTSKIETVYFMIFWNVFMKFVLHNHKRFLVRDREGEKEKQKKSERVINFRNFVIACVSVYYFLVFILFSQILFRLIANISFLNYKWWSCCWIMCGGNGSVCKQFNKKGEVETLTVLRKQLSVRTIISYVNKNLRRMWQILFLRIYYSVEFIRR